MFIHNNIQTPEEKWENATIANNFIFYKVMRNNPDVFKRGRAKYRFENLCVDDTGLKFNDRTYKLFFIAENYDKILNAEQKGVLKMIMNNESTTKFSDKVSGLVEDAKHNAYWRKQFLEYEIQQRLQFKAGKKEGFEEGKIQGAEQKAIEDAKRALNMHLTIEQAAEITGLSIEQVKELKATINS